MTTHKRYEQVARIFEIIDSLSKSQKMDVLKSHFCTNVTRVIQALVIDLPNNEMSNLYEELIESSLGNRAHPRKECRMIAEYAHEDRIYRDPVKDISESGAFILSTVDFEVGDEIVQSFSLSNMDLPMKFEGEVVRSDKSGIGIKFSNISTYQKDIIKSLLNELTPTS